jgi:signal transduction histidine kinase
MAVLASPDRLIFSFVRIGRPADDRAGCAFYGFGMRLPGPIARDRIAAGVLTGTLELETWLGGNAMGHRVELAALGPLFTLAVAFRRSHPEPVGIGAALGSVVMQTVWPSAELSFAIAWMCDVYALAVWTRPRPFAVGMGLYVAAALAGLPFSADAKAGFFFVVVSTIVVLLVRRVVGDRDRRARVAERERDVAAREAVVEERARIARELHDVIAHNVSMVVVQAGAERRVQQDEQAREVLATIETIGRGALTEMRRLVGMLRADGDDPLAPQPGLDDLATLVRQVRAAGLPVELRIDGERRPLPAGVELSAYRIVQEALTNALKYADGARASVSVRYGEESLELEIVDEGGGGATVSGGGHGLVGMRERVSLYGGRFDAGRRPEGGFAVRVALPVR